MAEALRVGFIGCGAFSTEALYPALQHVPVRLTAIASKTGQRAEAVAARFRAERTYTDHRTMLAAESLDAVFIAATPESHPQLVKDSLANGCHVFVEKPPADTVEAARDLVRAVRASGKVCQVGFMKRFAPAYRKAKELIDSGQFDPPTYLHAKVWGGRPAYAAPGTVQDPWVMLRDLTIHHSDLIRYLMGDIESLSACSTTRDGSTTFAALIQFKSGAIGTLVSSQEGSWLRDNERVELVGAGSSLLIEDVIRLRYLPAAHFDEMGGLTLPAAEVYEPNFTVPQLRNSSLFLHGYIQEIQAFIECILNQRVPLASMEDAYKAMRISWAMWQSHSQPVSLAEVAG